MPFYFKSSHLASAISVITLAVGLAVAESATQKSLAQTAPTQINGAGATFPEVLYTSKGGWFNTYGRAVAPATNPPGPINPNVQFNYNAIGSGAGISAFLTQVEPAGTNPPISFGATDAPLPLGPKPVSGTPNRGPAVQVPVVAGAITLSYNAAGLNVAGGALKLSRATYCGILTGNITNYNNSRITADNGGQQVSVNQAIVVVRRADSSGSTFLTSNHLNTICKTTPFPWNRGVGTNSVTGPVPANPAPNTVYWPSSFLSAEGGSGIAATINANRGGFGYVDNGTRRARGLSAATLQNRAGNFVSPGSPDAVSVAFATAPDLDPDPRAITVTVPDPAQATAYPIVGVTYQLYYDIYSSASVANGIRGFINDFVADPTPNPTASLNADKIAEDRGFAALPAALKTKVRNVVTTYVDTTAN